MLMSEIKRVIDQVSREKGIERRVLISALEEALRSAAKKKIGSKADIEVHYDDKTGEIEVFQFKEVAEIVAEPDLQIDFETAQSLILNVKSVTVSVPRWIPPPSGGLPPSRPSR